MAISRAFTVLLGVSAFATLSYAQDNSIYTNGVSSNAAGVFLDDDAAFGVCVYPVSGSYSFLNRNLYFCTLIFALFSRAHLWLVAGALIAALTFSGAAAVHACLLVWHGPIPYIENDSWALYSILSSACLITVPLLNWSGTLRRLGAKASSLRDPHGSHTQSDAGTRTIVVYWAFFVLVGFISIWLQIYLGAKDDIQEYPFMSKVMCNSGTNGSMLMSSDATFHRRAIDSQFIQQNGSVDPCSQVNIPSIFRQQSDLLLLPQRQALLWNSSTFVSKYQWAKPTEQVRQAEYNVEKLAFNLLPFILIQGFIVVLFGRCDPREIRDRIYISLFMSRPLSEKPSILRTQDYLIRLLAALNYCLAVAVIVLCPPLFILQLLATEVQFYNLLPDAEAPYSVGQWSSWAITVQVLLAALIGRYHDRVIRLLSDTYRRLFPSSREKKGWVNVTTADPQHELTSLNVNLKAGQPDLPPIPSDDSPDLSPPQRRPFSHRLRSILTATYKTFAHPLNQSNKGILDELRNDLHWIRDPQAVSRLVVRHPLRPRDLRKGSQGYVRSPLVEGEVFTSPELGSLGEKERLDSGFFRGASVHDSQRGAERVSKGIRGGGVEVIQEV